MTSLAPSSFAGGLIPLIARDIVRVMLRLGRGGTGLDSSVSSMPTSCATAWPPGSSMSTVESVLRWFMLNLLALALFIRIVWNATTGTTSSIRKRPPTNAYVTGSTSEIVLLRPSVVAVGNAGTGVGDGGSDGGGAVGGGAVGGGGDGVGGGAVGGGGVGCGAVGGGGVGGGEGGGAEGGDGGGADGGRCSVVIVTCSCACQAAAGTAPAGLWHRW